MVSTPLLLMFWEPLLVVPVVLPLTLLVDMLIVIPNRRTLEPRKIAPLVIAGVLGIPLGTWILLFTSSHILRLGIAGLVLASATLMLLGLSVNISRERIASAAAGFLSGLMVTSTAISGPPVALFMINQKWAKDTIRTSLGLYFLVLDSLAVVSLLIVGTLNKNTLVVSLILGPLVIAGYLVSTKLLPYVQQAVFIRIATLVAIGSAGVAILTTLV